MVGRRQSRSRLDDGGRHAEPDVDLGQLAAGRPAAEDEQAGRQLAGERRVAVRPDRDRVDAVDAAALFEVDPTATTTFVAVELVRGGVVAHDDPPVAVDRARSAIGDDAGRDERIEVARVVGFGRARRPVDHVVARASTRAAQSYVAGLAWCRPRCARSDFEGRQPMCGQLPPNQRRSTTATDAPSSRALNAAASPAGPAPMIDEVERVHGHPLVVRAGSPRWRRAS